MNPGRARPTAMRTPTSAGRAAPGGHRPGTWRRAQWARALLTALVAGASAVPGCAPAPPANSPALVLSDAERAALLRHGPWPPPVAQDPGNAASGQTAAIALGRRLFSESRLSPDGRMACATCHQPGRAFSDGLPRAIGREPLERNTPSLLNAVHQRWQGWDGAADSLWSQALRPLLDPREMASRPEHVSRLLIDDTELAAAYRAVFGPASQQPEEQVMVNAAKALGAYVGSLVSPRTTFDEFRDALARGDAQAAARYPASALRGARLFVGKAACHVCHSGPMFSHGEFGDIGLRFFVRPGVVDAGRHGGIQALRRSPYNLLSRWSDSPADDPATLKTRQLMAQHRNFGEFKVPSLRSVADTPPYMHDGQLATLEEVIRHYSELDLERLHADGDQILRPLHLSAQEQVELLDFLRTLSPAR